MGLERLGSFAKSPADIAEVEESIAQCHSRAWDSGSEIGVPQLADLSNQEWKSASQGASDLETLGMGLPKGVF